jgi:hypothetical protein
MASESGDCRRHAPVISRTLVTTQSYGDNNSPSQPCTRGDYWCGDFEQRTEPPSEGASDA